MTKKVAIIGAGPAGIATALQLHRYGVDFILFESPQKKSLLNNAWRVENYLGFCSGISGIDLLKNFQLDLTRNKIKKISDEIKNLNFDYRAERFVINTDSKIYYVNRVVVASGTKPKVLSNNLTASADFCLFYDVLPLLKKRGKNILIIGAGDGAFDNGINLAKNNNVIICNRGNFIDALPLLVDKANKMKNIRYFCGYKLKELKYLTQKKKLSCKFKNNKENVYFEVDYVLVAIGRLPQKDFYSDSLALNEKQLIKDKKLFLAGDVRNKSNRQVAIAVGDGIKTAMNVFHDLK